MKSSILKIVCLITLFINFFSCTKQQEDSGSKYKMDISKELYGKTTDGSDVYQFTLTNNNGIKVKIIDFGGTITEIWTPNKNGELQNVALGYDSFQEYENNAPYMGIIVGRYGNRIGKAKFSLDGTEYKLVANNNGNHLHGGIKHFGKVIWNAEQIKSDEKVALKLTYLSKDGEEGYPGNLSTTVIYSLNDDNELTIEYAAETDKPTVVNLTNHAYFNLEGTAAKNILDHELMLNADKFTPVDDGLITTGELRDVKGTPMDFTTPVKIGAHINDDYEQLKKGLGYDHNWVLNKSGDSLSLAARVFEPTSGRVMEVLTTEPGIQFYSGNFLDGTLKGNGGKTFNYRFGLCLETQHYPDSPNKLEFPSTRLNPGEKYLTTTVYRFSTK